MTGMIGYWSNKAGTGTIADGSITTSMLAPGAVTEDKLDPAAIPAPTVPTAADVGALPYNVRAWNGTSWSTRPTVPAGTSVECFSDGTNGSTADAAAPAPPDSVAGDIWWRAA